MAANPAAGIPRADLGLVETPRERTLSDDELRRLWPALAQVHPLHAAIYRLVLLTSLRPGEVCSLKWSDVGSDAHGRFALLRKEETKSGEGRRVPLSSEAVAELEVVRELGYDSEYVFPSGGKSGHMENPKAVTAKLLAISELERFTPHDLRRTARTLLSSIGVRPDIAERLLGHVTGTATSRVYDRFAYDGELQDAAEQLGEKIAAIVADEPPKKGK